VIAVDTNLLVYAHRGDSPFHEIALQSVALLAESIPAWAIPWPCLHEFFSIVTHPRIYAPPTPVDEAIDQVDAWLESPSLRVLAESEMHWEVLRRLIARGKVSGPQVHDARIAALCLQHGVQELWSADRDFSRYPELRTVNPLIRKLTQ
jgi:hypothetical protein